MANLSNFSVLSFGSTGPIVSITKNGVTFNKAAVDRMGGAQYVLLLLDESAKQFAIQKCTQSAPQAMPFVAAIKPGAPSVRWGSKEFLRILKRLTGWSLEDEDCKGFKVPGEYQRPDNAMIFDLNKAVPIN